MRLGRPAAVLSARLGLPCCPARPLCLVVRVAATPSAFAGRRRRGFACGGGTCRPPARVPGRRWCSGVRRSLRCNAPPQPLTPSLLCPRPQDTGRVRGEGCGVQRADLARSRGAVLPGPARGGLGRHELHERSGICSAHPPVRLARPVPPACGVGLPVLRGPPAADACPCRWGPRRSRAAM